MGKFNLHVTGSFRSPVGQFDTCEMIGTICTGNVRVYEDENECATGKAPCAGSDDYVCINRLGSYSCAPKLLRYMVKNTAFAGVFFKGVHHLVEKSTMTNVLEFQTLKKR
jgi:hypothetical protein